jgi:hypothetical protein
VLWLNCGYRFDRFCGKEFVGMGKGGINRSNKKAGRQELTGHDLWLYSAIVSRDADNQPDVQRVALCAQCLREHWPRADPMSLEKAAVEWGRRCANFVVRRRLGPSIRDDEEDAKDPE